MVNGFEEETGKLTEYELSLAVLVAGGIRMRVGKKQAITANEIVKAMTAKGHKISPPRVRKIIHFLVTTKQVTNLVATSKGYYIAKTEEEVRLHVESLMQRAASIVVRAQAYQCYAELALGVKQMKIFAQ